MQILVAPDKFKGTLSAEEVASALVRGARRVHPEAAFIVRPLADGGEGTMDALLSGLGGRVNQAEVSDPYGRSIFAPIARLENGAFCIEMARASGLMLVPDDDRDPWAASSQGTGELIRAIIEWERSPSADIIVGVGGSASTDGGTGAARAIGWRFLDARGHELPPGGGALRDLTRIDNEHIDRRLQDVTIMAACDVDNPLCGPTGAARVFAPQKGASPDQVEILEEALQRLADTIQRDLGMNVASARHAGAGGGMGAGLAVFFGATLRSGFDLVADVISLHDDIRRADLVITGEGRLDAASLAGKAPIGLVRLCARENVPCIGIAGDLALERAEWKAQGFETAIGLAQSGGEGAARADPAAAIERAVEGVLRHRMDRTAGRTPRRRGFRNP